MLFINVYKLVNVRERKSPSVLLEPSLTFKVVKLGSLQ